MKKNRQVLLTTKDLDLVLLETSDAEVLASWFNNYEISKFLGRGDFPITIPYEENYLEKVYKDQSKLQLGIWHRKDKKLIGTTGIHEINSTHLQGSFGITIGEPNYWSDGYGTQTLEAMLDWSFRIRGLRLITLRVYGNNPRGRRCYEKCGFEHVGTIPNSVFKDGEWIDENIMLKRSPFLN